MWMKQATRVGGLLAGALLDFGLTGCATAPLSTSGSLASYDNLAPSDGILTKSRMRVSKPDILQAKSVAIVPTVFSTAALQSELTDKQRRVIANAVDRSVCIGLSDRFVVVPPGQKSDLTVHLTITHVTVTDANIAGASKVASIVPTALSLPIMVPRIPIGMGSLAIEAEARDTLGGQKAAFVWARGADMLTSTPRISASGDAYDLAAEFGADFSKMLVTGESPFNKTMSLPGMHRVSSSLGQKPKNAACDAFGRLGIPAFVAGKMGSPPELVDDAMPVVRD